MRKKPTRYRRNEKLRVIGQRALHTEVPTASLVRFAYGTYKPKETGGWKNDPRPLLLIFRDDTSTAIVEGINLTYLSDGQLKRMMTIVKQFERFLEDEERVEEDKRGLVLYTICKAQIPDILNHAYRRYKRKLIRRYILVRFKKDAK